MKKEFTYIDNTNPTFIDDLYLQFKENPESIDSSWGKFFEGYDFANKSTNGSAPTIASDKEVAVMKLIHGYRSRGHLIAKTNPIRQRRTHKSDLELDYFGLSNDDLNKTFECGNEVKLGKATLQEILNHLQKTYCDSIGAEFMYCRNEKIRQFLYEKMETIANKPSFSLEEKKHILNKIDQAVTFESFLQTKYVGKKRFSLEGLEALIPSLDAAIRSSSDMGAVECALGMAHRGRLNVLVNIFEKSYENVFSEFEDNITSEMFERGGDVKYHLGKSADIITVDGKPYHLSMLPNPSHLEAIGPILQGAVYAKKEKTYDGDLNKILPIIIHGDAAIAGQGVNYEQANMSQIDGYKIGGIVHIVLNNQVGFTANYKEGRSSVYCTDLAKVTESPVFHVNADDPLAVVHAMQMAILVRQTFNIDVYIDILGYRRYGHNESDEPRFTQPQLYKSIPKHPNIYNVYLDNLVNQGDISKEEAKSLQQSFKDTLQQKLNYAKENPIKPSIEDVTGEWMNYRLATDEDFDESIATGIEKSKLDHIAKQLVSTPEEFNLFSKSKKLLQAREKFYFHDNIVDWALAEQLAFGSLLTEGHGVRLVGQDSQRGTFSHRHAVIKDNESEEHYTPLNNINENQEKIEVYNSLLSEYAALAFEYGYSLALPNSLVLWEAQFGDFANGAQIVIDQFISSAEYKWRRMSGIVMLLPHGYEGQGPEHSSARFERFLQLCAENNMYVVNLTTPANYFHALRRQIKNDFRKPLVVMSPKSLLRHPKVISNIEELNNSKFQEIIDDTVDVKSVKRAVICTGKIYFDLIEKREELRVKDVAIIRMEQLYPLPKKQLVKLKRKYGEVEWVWAQEEPENMGPWPYITRQMRGWPMTIKARKESASPATGSNRYHNKAQDALVNDILTTKK